MTTLLERRARIYEAITWLDTVICNGNTILSNSEVYMWIIFQLLLGGDTIEYNNLSQVSDKLYCIQLYTIQLLTF
jgi:hypothetical protein